MDLGIRDKIALVTGGARSLGKADALLLAAEGCRVAIVDLNEEGAEETAALPETEMAEGAPGGEAVEEAPASGENLEAVPETEQAEGAAVQDSDQAEQTEAAVGEEIAAQADHSGEMLPEDNSGGQVPEEKEKE